MNEKYSHEFILLILIDKNPSTLCRLLLLFSSFYTWSRLDHFWSNLHQRDHRSGCFVKRFIVLLLCIQFVFATLNNSHVSLIALWELSRKLRAINYNLCRHDELTIQGRGVWQLRINVYWHRSTHGRKKEISMHQRTNYMKLSENWFMNSRSWKCLSLIHIWRCRRS